MKPTLWLLITATIFFTSACSMQKIEPLTTHIESGNIFLVYSDSSSRQLTFTNSDRNPVYMDRHKGVLFFREDSHSKGKFIFVNEETLIETVLLDSLDIVKEAIVSSDQTRLCVINNNVLMCVALTKGVPHVIAPACSFVFIDENPLMHNCIVINIEHEGHRRTLSIDLLDSAGTLTKEFKDYKNIEDFIKQTIPAVHPKLVSKFELVNRRLVTMDSLDHFTTLLNQLALEQEAAETNLKAAQDRLNSINTFRIGRSLREKELQIKNQKELTQLLEEKLANVRHKHYLLMKRRVDTERDLAQL